MSDYERGFKAGVEAAAKHLASLGDASDKMAGTFTLTKAVRGTEGVKARIYRHAAKLVRALAAPREDEPRCEHGVPLTIPCCGCQLGLPATATPDATCPVCENGRLIFPWNCVCNGIEPATGDKEGAAGGRGTAGGAAK